MHGGGTLTCDTNDARVDTRLHFVEHRELPASKPIRSKLHDSCVCADCPAMIAMFPGLRWERKVEHVVIPTSLCKVARAFVVLYEMIWHVRIATWQTGSHRSPSFFPRHTFFAARSRGARL